MSRLRVNNSKQPTILPENFRLFLYARFRELTGFGLFALGLYILASLLSYDSSDPAINMAVDGPFNNIGGEYGALIADALIPWVGFMSFLPVITMISWGRKRLINAPVRSITLKIMLMPVAMAFTLTGGALLHKVFPAFPEPGLLGHVFSFEILNLGRFWQNSIVDLIIMGIFLSIGLGLCVYIISLTIAETLGLAKIFRFITMMTLGIVSWGKKVKNKTEKQKIAPTIEEKAPINSTRRVMERVKELAEMQDISKTKQDSLNASQATELETIDELEEYDDFFDLSAPGNYQLPPLNLLVRPKERNNSELDEDEIREKAKALKSVLEEFGVRGEISNVRPGPVVTLYELVPAPGIKSSRVIGLADDIARSMSALSARVAVIPGQNAIGIELPNDNRETVFLRELITSQTYENNQGSLAMALGKDISGAPVIADLARMPHLLVAGTTGSGKSVGINSMILSLLYRLPPDRCKLIMIDPKMLELSVYDGIPHLLTPVVTDPKKAVVALKWTVREMENRYRSMSKLGVRNIMGYNQRVTEARDKGEKLVRQVQTGFDQSTGKPIFETQDLDLDQLPYIVVVVDEMADLMLVAGKDIEAAVQRLAQMARAAGIHLIMATQRPSVDVITGTIKANFPTRISFAVTSKIDSRTILGEMGAEQLLGQGDMLYMAPGGRITRLHGPFVGDSEVEKVVKFLKNQSPPEYIEEIIEDVEGTFDDFDSGNEGSGDELYNQAVALILREGKVSTSFIQRHLKIGYNRAARIVDEMEAQGVVGQANHVGKREILGRTA